jgi:hypothetical protein
MSTLETMRRRFERGEFNALCADMDAPTDDDVSITTDGSRLDTVEKVVAFLDEINAERAARAPDAG